MNIGGAGRFSAYDLKSKKESKMEPVLFAVSIVAAGNSLSGMLNAQDMVPTPLFHQIIFTKMRTSVPKGA